MASDEQIERVRKLASLLYDLDTKDRIALSAVLAELATLRANMSSLVDSSIEPPRQVREERDRLRELRDALLRWQRAGEGSLEAEEVDAALAKCQEQSTHPATK